MRKLLVDAAISLAMLVLVMAAVVATVSVAHCQPPPSSIHPVGFTISTPAGSCQTNGPMLYDLLTNTMYGCTGTALNQTGTWTVVGTGGGGGGGTGTPTVIAKFLTATNIGNSSATDDGVTFSMTTENLNLGTNALLTTLPNDGTTGTSPFTITKISSSSNAIIASTTDSNNVLGVCVINCTTTGNAAIAVQGQVQCYFDGQTVVRDWVTISSGTAGYCHDAGSTQPNGIQSLGRVVNLNAGAGTTATIALNYPDSGNAAPPVLTFQVANANPGTVLNEAVIVTGAPSTATVAATSTIGGIIGICSGGCGNSGNATILQSGAALCVFDGATTAGHYVQVSSTNAGECHDAGATYPVPNQVIGRVTSTNGSGGTYGILVFPPESSNPATATIASGTTNDVVKYTAANAIGPSAATLDSSSNFATPGSVSTGTGGGVSGSLALSGSSSGSATLSVPAAAGAAHTMQLPTAKGSANQCLATDGGTPEQWSYISCGGGSPGTVTSFSAGTLSPLFTTSVATATTTPALSFSLTNAGAGTVFGNTSSSSGAPAYTSTPVLGVDNATAGTLQTANGSANAHTIWGSAATTSNTILGFATAPTTGHLVDVTVSGSTATLHDSGVATSAVGTVTSVATTSPITGGTITTTGTIACPTCVVASSPGAGFANFAGSTQTVTSVYLTRSLMYSFGDAATGSALTTSEVGYLTVPFACTIAGWHIMADAGTVTIKTWRVNGGAALPTSGNSISTSGVSLSSGTKVDSTTVTDWTSTAIAANDTLGFAITAVATAKQITFQIDCRQTAQ